MAAALLFAALSMSVHPSGPTLAENTLRIELRYAAPPGGSFEMRFVRLLDADGHAVEDAFLDLPLANADGTRVSLLLHPGRVKSGLVAHERLGRALKRGTSVTLVVADPRLARPVTATWRVTANDEVPPAPEGWRLDAPAAGTRAALAVTFDDVVAASADGALAVTTHEGRRVPGRGVLGSGERTWRFVPARPWRAGAYVLAVHPQLEDPSGNRICHPFEFRLGADACVPTLARPFHIAAHP